VKEDRNPKGGQQQVKLLHPDRGHKGRIHDRSLSFPANFLPSHGKILTFFHRLTMECIARPWSRVLKRFV
jgi:hypothetical protein